MRAFLHALRTLPAADWRRAALISALATLVCTLFPAAALWSCKVGPATLGRRTLPAGLLSDVAPPAWAGQLDQAGQAALDQCWRMPLDEDYGEGLKSNFADVGNVAGRAGGSITAAKFLQRFVGDAPWAHLDIAGTAWKEGAAKGATGRPVALLLHYLLQRAA